MKKHNSGIEILEIGHQLYSLKFESCIHRRNYTSRELIKFAKIYTSENKRSSTDKGNLKHFNDAINRRETRDLLAKEEYDKIPDKNNLTKKEDPWKWD